MRSPRFPKGIDAAVGPREILRSQTRLLHLSRRISGLSDDEYADLVLASIMRLAGWTGLLPASRSHHHFEAGGLFRHSLQTAVLASQISEGVIFSRTGTYGQIRRNRSRWRLAAFMGGLFHDVGKVAALYEVYSDNECSRGKWMPQAESLAEWCAENGVSEYFLKWRGAGDSDRIEHERLNELLFGIIAPKPLVAYLSDSEPDNVFQELMQCLSGSAGQSALARVVAEADAESCRRYLREHPAETAPDEGAGYPERRCFAALRMLIADGRVRVNEPGQPAWLVNGCLFLEWTEPLYALIRGRLEQEGARGIPASRDAMLGMLAASGMIGLHDVEDPGGGVSRSPLWTIEVETDGARRTVEGCVFITSRARILPPQVASLPGGALGPEPDKAAGLQEQTREEAEPQDAGAGNPDSQPEADSGGKPRSEASPESGSGAASPSALRVDAEQSRLAEAVERTVREGMAVPGLLGVEDGAESAVIGWRDFAALARLGMLREADAAQGMDEAASSLARRMRAALPPELPALAPEENALKEMLGGEGAAGYLTPLVRLTHLREAVPALSDFQGRIGEMVPVWVAAAKSCRAREPFITLDKGAEVLSIQSWGRFAAAHGVAESEGRRILERLAAFGEDVRNPAVVFRDPLTCLVVSFLASGERALALRAAVLQRLEAVFAGHGDPRTPLGSSERKAGSVRARTVERSGTKAEAGVREQVRAEEPAKSTVQSLERDYSAEFAMLLRRGEALIAGRRTRIAECDGVREIRVAATAVAAFLAEAGLTGGELDRIRRVQFSETRLEQLGIGFRHKRRVVELAMRAAQQEAEA